MNILITGGAGFIGANTADYYLSKGHKVTIFDNLSRPGVQTNLDWLTKTHKKNLHITTEDVRNAQAINTAIQGIDVVFHLAGQTAVTTSINDPASDFSINAQGTFNVVEALRLYAPHATLLYASTNKVYGALSRYNTREVKSRHQLVGVASVSETEQLDFYSPYGTSKGTGDQYVRDYARIYNLNTIVFRQSCIYGVHQFGVEDQGWLAHFAAQVIKGNPLTIFGDGKQVRDVLFISDLISAYDQAISHIEFTKGEVYNIGGGISHTLSLLELLQILQNLSGKTIKPTYKKARLGDQKVYISNLDKAYRDFNWQPQIDVTTGVELMYRWLEKNLYSTH